MTRTSGNIALIPARGGSTRIPGKNIRLFRGKPIIAWSIEAALASGLFARVLVSTDAPEIAAVAQRHGAETLARPAALADNFTPLAPVLLQALEELTASGETVDRLCCILATAPFVRAGDLRDAHALLVRERAATVVSVTHFPSPPQRALTLTPSGKLVMLWPEYELTRSNDLPDAYHDAGQFYWLDAARFLAKKRIFSPDAAPFVLPRDRVQDIDTEEDWRRAERLAEVLSRDEAEP